MPRLGTGPWLWEGPRRSPPPSQVGGSANPGWTRPCRKEEEGQGKRRATPDICGARAKLQDTKTRAPPLQAGDGGSVPTVLARSAFGMCLRGGQGWALAHHFLCQV